MPRIIVRLDGSVIQEFVLTRFRTSLGRRPSNDVVLDSQAVSGEHLVLQLSGDEVYVEDLGSTNGTLVNGKTAVREQLLQNKDVIGVGPFAIEYLDDAPDAGFEQTMSMQLTRGAAKARAVPQRSAGAILLSKFLTFFSLKKPK